MEQAQGSVLKIVVDYSTHIINLIQKGKYDKVNPLIYQALFKVTSKEGKYELPINVVRTTTPHSAEGLTNLFKNKCLRHASTEEILTLGFTYPDMQRDSIIVGLNAVCTFGENKFVLYLSGNNEKREISLAPIKLKDEWGTHCRFLAFELNHNQKKLPISTTCL